VDNSLAESVISTFVDLDHLMGKLQTISEGIKTHLCSFNT
jgi:hypothetical protein